VDGTYGVAAVSTIVYSFLDQEAATSAAEQLIGRLSLPPGAISLGTHALMGSSHDGLPLLAAFVPSESVDAAVAIVEDAGGTLIEVR
jgi:hypothetical protein